MGQNGREGRAREREELRIRERFRSAGTSQHVTLVRFRQGLAEFESKFFFVLIPLLFLPLPFLFPFKFLRSPHTTVLTIPRVVADAAGKANNADNYASCRQTVSYLDLTLFRPRRELVMCVRFRFPLNNYKLSNHGRPVIKTRTASLLELPTTLTLALTFPVAIHDHVANANQQSSPSWTHLHVQPATTLVVFSGFFLLSSP
ncbi:hypothetical protein BDN72DRAFT_865809 [Pluteus cervinus]|uniref:Uncharacterized protein n=1 Tax=Pluteus cervinus TaxID=181527 RepID=A0ACD2ZZ82_9AGAR|nr:hypothetical protein BDN72DRAFT_865809 [Pluteus cervinus]